MLRLTSSLKPVLVGFRRPDPVVAAHACHQWNYGLTSHSKARNRREQSHVVEYSSAWRFSSIAGCYTWLRRGSRACGHRAGDTIFQCPSTILSIPGQAADRGAGEIGTSETEGHQLREVHIQGIDFLDARIAQYEW
jgi:hypothetical protein